MPDERERGFGPIVQSSTLEDMRPTRTELESANLLEVRSITGGKPSDEDRAKALLDSAAEPVAAITSLLTEARREGLELQISWQVDQFGRFFPSLAVVKPLVRR